MSDLDGDGDLDMLVANFASNTVSVRLNGATGPLAATAARAGAEVLLYPNPAGAQFAVAVPAGAGATAALFNSLGQRVRGNIVLAATGAPTVVATEGLARGVYALRVSIGTGTVVKQVVIQ